MKIAIASDLHLEHLSAFRKDFIGPDWEGLECDVLVLAGDIHNGPERVIQYADLMQARLDCDVVVVAGNHEYYGRILPFELKVFRNLSSKRDRVHFLENEIVKIDDVTFIGATFWTDFQFKNTPDKCKMLFDTFINDSRLIKNDDGTRMKASDTEIMHLKSKEFIWNMCSPMWQMKNVVVTHHGPSALCNRGYESSDVSSSFVSDLDNFIEECQANVWISGHTHSRVDEMVGDTRLISNCRGYEHHGETEGWEWKVIEL